MPTTEVPVTYGYLYQNSKELKSQELREGKAQSIMETHMTRIQESRNIILVSKQHAYTRNSHKYIYIDREKLSKVQSSLRIALGTE